MNLIKLQDTDLNKKSVTFLYANNHFFEKEIKNCSHLQ